MLQKILITGSGRCGTCSMAQFLDGMESTSGERIVARHETSRKYFLESVINNEWESVENFFYSLSHQVEVSPYISLLPENLVKNALLIALIRDGRHTVRSGMNSGWFLNLNHGEVLWEECLPEFKGDRFEKCCQLWTWVYKKLESWNSKFFKLEELVDNKEVRNIFFATLGIVPSSKVFSPSNSALLRKKRVIDMGNKELPDWEEWTSDQRATFALHCGELMNKYYPHIDLVK